MNVVLIDLDGVLYEGESAVDGAADAVNALRERGIPRLFLTNTTSRPRSAIIEKLAGMGLDVAADSLLTPAVAAARWLRQHCPGAVALFVDPATAEDLGDLPIAAKDDAEVGAVVVGDYGERWNFAELNRAFRYLAAEPQPALVALGMTRYWKAEDGLRLDTAPFVVALAHASGAEPVVLGKPASAFFETALEMLDAEADDAIMIGDDILSDVGGAQDAGIRAVLVRTGKFREEDLDGDVEPYAVLDSIAELPDRWDELAAK